MTALVVIMAAVWTTGICTGLVLALVAPELVDRLHLIWWRGHCHRVARRAWRTQRRALKAADR